VVGMRQDRRLDDGRHLKEVRSGERVTPSQLSYPVTVARHHLRRKDEQETRFIVATFTARGVIIARWGKRRWAIEAFFKTAKGRFALSRFAQQTLLGSLRFLVLSFLAFALTQYKTWTLPKDVHLAWQSLAQDLRRLLLPHLVRTELLAELACLPPHPPSSAKLT
jgi:hypothetical protein